MSMYEFTLIKKNKKIEKKENLKNHSDRLLMWNIGHLNTITVRNAVLTATDLKIKTSL